LLPVRRNLKGIGDKMKWLWKRNEKKCEHKLCECGGVKTRQTTLTEFDKKLMLQKEQTLLSDYMYLNETVGLQGTSRKYRGPL